MINHLRGYMILHNAIATVTSITVDV